MTAFPTAASRRVPSLRDLQGYWQRLQEDERLQSFVRHIDALYRNKYLRSFVFEPFASVFDISDIPDQDQAAFSAITMVAFANGTLALLPAKAGIGMPVSVALELWLARTLAEATGLDSASAMQTLVHADRMSIAVVSGLLSTKQILGLGTGLIPFASVPAEVALTDTLGASLLVGFEEVRASDRFRIPAKKTTEILRLSRDIASKQYACGKQSFSRENLLLVKDRLLSWVSGNDVATLPQARAEAFVAAAMAALIAERTASLSGPMGSVFVDAVRRGYSIQLGDASLEDMGAFFAARTPSELRGDLSLIKGEMHERLEILHENADGDSISATLHDSRSIPGSDAVYVDEATGESIAVSYKAVGSPDQIETALERFPEIPIVATSEAASPFGDDPRVTAGAFSNAELNAITEQNVDRAIDSIQPIDAVDVVQAGIGMEAVAILWPFAIAAARGRIPMRKFVLACTAYAPKGGLRLASRLMWAVAAGPVFGPYLFARSAAALAKGAATQSDRRMRRIEFR